MKLRLDDVSIDPCRVFCIGWNYADHVKELNNPIPSSPAIFMKPNTCLVPEGETIGIPAHGEEFHWEVELVVLIGRQGKVTTEEEAASFIRGLSLGLDLTLRDVQRSLKEARRPWEMAKAFEQSAPIGTFVPCDALLDLQNIAFTCHVNDELKQDGNTKDMIFPVSVLLQEISKAWVLRPGDLVYTGTPPGVGCLNAGDKVRIASESIGAFEWEIGVKG